MNINDAKRILNKNNESPYTDSEIEKIIKLIEGISDVICHYLTNKKS